MSLVSSPTWSAQSDPSLEAGAQKIARAWLKRLIDILGAGLGLLALGPILLLIAAMIVMETRGNALFRQRRSGYHGGPFVIYKFRTMRVAEDGPTIVQAVRGDDRITWFGRILRRASIDELPQLINVLKGEMSLVGPRPHAVAHDEMYAKVIPDYDRRFLVKPGLTGLAQVEGLRGETADVSEMASRVEKDLEYIRDWSLWLDIQILLRTVLIFLFQPAY